MDLLNLSGYAFVPPLDDSKPGWYSLTLNCTISPQVCLRCGMVHPDVYGHGIILVTFLDTTMHGRKVKLIVRRRRYKCRACGQTFMQALPHMDEKRMMTSRLLSYIHEQTGQRERSFVSIGKEVGLTDKTIREIFEDHAAARQVARTKAIHVAPIWLGIDELYVRKRFRCILTDVKERRLIDMLVDRDYDTIATRLATIVGRDQVEVVTMDMYPAYRKIAAAFFRNAQPIVDKFHILRTANKALDEVRLQESRNLTLRQRRRLMRDRRLLLKREAKLTDRQSIHLDAWLANFPLLRDAYRLKEEFYAIWDETDRATAERQFQLWRKQVTPNLAKPFRHVLSPFKTWHQEIFAYFDTPVTNAYTEALNGVIRVSNRVGRGYTFEVLRQRMLLQGELLTAQIDGQYDVSPATPHGIPAQFEALYQFHGPSLSTVRDMLAAGVFMDDST